VQVAAINLEDRIVVSCLTPTTDESSGWPVAVWQVIKASKGQSRKGTLLPTCTYCTYIVLQPPVLSITHHQSSEFEWEVSELLTEEKGKLIRYGKAGDDAGVKNSRWKGKRILSREGLNLIEYAMPTQSMSTDWPCKDYFWSRRSARETDHWYLFFIFYEQHLWNPSEESAVQSWMLSNSVTVGGKSNQGNYFPRKFYHFYQEHSKIRKIVMFS
jgi:hypothetical protein